MNDKELINILLRILEVVHGDRETLDEIETELENLLPVTDRRERLVRTCYQLLNYTRGAEYE